MSEQLAIAMLSHLASRCAPTGAERSLALLAEGLHTRGHRVVVVAPGPWVLTDELRAGGVEVQTIASRPCWLSYWERRPWPVVLAKVLRFAWPTGARRRLGRFLSRWQPDVVHVNCLPHLDGALAARRSGRPVLWHIREILPEGARRRWWARHLRRDADHIVAVSEATAAWLRAEGLGDRVEVIYNGVQVPQEAPDGHDLRGRLGFSADDAVVGVIGQLLPHKGLEVVLAALERVAPDVPTLRALIAGDGPARYVRSLQRSVADSRRLSTRVRFAASQPDATELIVACDAVCVPTLTPDPLPRIVLEAMALGRPVIGSAIGGIPELIVDDVTGWLVPAGDGAALSAALTRIATEPQSRWRFGEAGRERARLSFTMDCHVTAIADLLTTMLGTLGARS